MNIYLIGFMGSGKSFLGQAAALNLGLSFTDLDLQVKGDINSIFKNSGEDFFRKLEYNALNKVLPKQNLLVACGGGIITYPPSFKALKNQNTIFLDTDFDICYKRIKNSNRPLVQNNTYNSLKELYNLRRDIYINCAKYTLKNANLNSLYNLIKKGF